MAELLSMGEGVLKKIASLALVEAVAIYGVEDQITELRETLSCIEAKLSDAETQQWKNHCQQMWLDRLEDIIYDAEDLLDELECEAERKKVISRYGGVEEKVSFFFTDRLRFRDKLSRKVKEINERLSKISYDKDQFDLNLESTDDGMAHMNSQEMTYSYKNKPDVIGRDADKEKIIEMLMQPTDDKNLSVIPIVGMGGLGKTDLAKLVFSDDSVKEKFKLQLWVWVSKDFDFEKIIERIIRCAGESLSNPDIEQLQSRLQDTIKDKTFLLVLDDVWRDVCREDFCRWKQLRDLLRVGASESKIIVTTRDSKVASTIGTHRPYNLEGLSYESFMALFKRCASSGKEKEPRTELLEIGKYNFEISQGMPLLAVILGSLLPREEEEWYGANMREREARELVEVKILPRLKLSYDDLPIHLKRCFSILSLFPKGQKIKAGKLIRLWVALGLIIPTKEKQKPEDIGVDYVKDLGQRSLIQEIEECGSELSFKVPNLVHSLATTVGRKYCSSTGDLNPLLIPESVRYISIPTTSLEEIPDYDGVPPFLRNKTSKKLRAIMIQSQVDERVITRKFARTCISKCNPLRYLDLSYGSFEKLPSSIGNVKQLRSLILSENKQLKKLPDTICKLQNLLHLDVSGCSELDELPKNMKRLVNLMYLYITTKQESLQKSGIQYLKNLKFLGLKACQNLLVLFKGAYRLTGLQELLIKDCGRSISVPFGELISLERLSIKRCPLLLIQKKTSFPSRLCVLSITSLEQVMELLQRLNESAYTLKSLCIRDCPNFTALPEWLPNYTCLKEICLIQCPNLASMPQGIQSLTALKELHILHCGELSKRCDPQSGEDWHKIAHVPRIKLDSKQIQWTDD